MWKIVGSNPTTLINKGWMTEWLKVPILKIDIRKFLIVGSNPTSSKQMKGSV